MKVELISHTANAALLCGEAAAICTNSDKPESAFCHVVDSGHTSILEHAVFTFRIEGISRIGWLRLMFRVSGMLKFRNSLMKILMRFLFSQRALRIRSFAMKQEALSDT